jgi:hypothetical protein
MAAEMETDVERKEYWTVDGDVMIGLYLDATQMYVLVPHIYGMLAYCQPTAQPHASNEKTTTMSRFRLSALRSTMPTKNT